MEAGREVWLVVGDSLNALLVVAVPAARPRPLSRLALPVIGMSWVLRVFLLTVTPVLLLLLLLPLCRMHLKGAVSKHGGRTTPFMSMKGVTHVIAENLSAVKTDKAMKVAVTLLVSYGTLSANGLQLWKWLAPSVFSRFFLCLADGTRECNTFPRFHV